MGKLIQIQQSESLSEIDKSILQARQSKKIKDCSGREIKTALAYVLTLLGEMKFMENNQNTTALSILVNSLYRGFPHLRIDELKTAFDLASDQKFQVNLSLYNRVFNSEFVAKVVKAYQEYRKPTIVIEHNMLDDSDYEPTREEKQKKVDEAIQDSFIKYKETKIMPTTCAWIYQEIELKEGFIHSVDEKNDFFSKAKHKENNRLEDLKKTSDFLGVKEILRLQQTDSNSNRIKATARELALQDYWNELIISEQL